MNSSGVDILAVVIALVNLAMVGFRTNQVLGKNRLITFAWVLITYWSFFLVMLAIGGPFTKFRGFRADLVTVTADTIRYSCIYVLCFNALFLLTEVGVWHLFRGGRTRVTWIIRKEERWLRIATLIYGAFLLGGGLLYWLKTRGMGYYDGYVQFQGSNWPSAFLWAAAPLITIKAFEKKYWLSLLCTVPFLVFAVLFHVRAFALLSLIPALIVMYFQYVGKDAKAQKRRFRAVVLGIAGAIVLVGLSNVVTFGKLDQETFSAFPDSGLVYGMNIVMEMANKLDVSTGWDSLIHYSQNIANPFMKLLGIPRSEVPVPPQVMATLVDGVPPNYGVFYHYPTLWYSDAYLAFRIAGLALAVLWGALLSGWELVMIRRPFLMALMLPFYTFHTYMLLRGAIDSATTPFSYSFYLALLVVLALAPRKMWKRERVVVEANVARDAEKVEQTSSRQIPLSSGE